MNEDHSRKERDESLPRGKRSGRDGLSPESQPAEFADDLRTNRFEPPPEPHEEKKKR